jgi:two-component system chemotaxis response regulator CheB
MSMLLNLDDSPSFASPAPCFDVVAIAASTGGIRAVMELLGVLPSTFPASILLVQHRSVLKKSYLADLLSRRTVLPVVDAAQGDSLRPGTVFVAPPGAHLLLAPDRTLMLVDGPPIGYVRPAADMLFGSIAAWAGKRAIGVVLSGMQQDGAAGAAAIKRAGGRILVQDPATCLASSMPAHTLATGCVDFVLPPAAIGCAVTALVMMPGAHGLFRVPTATSAANAAGAVTPSLRSQCALATKLGSTRRRVDGAVVRQP